MHAFTQASGDSIYWPRVFAAALALSLTGAFMVFMSINHPPAGATTLIVALGILSKGEYLFAIEAAVLLLTVQAWILNHLAGLAYPIWRYDTHAQKIRFAENYATKPSKRQSEPGPSNPS
jgi:CBS-domain-containing membrane protein